MSGKGFLGPTSTENEQEEISPKEMLRNLLMDDTLKDTSLRGTDGGTVRASRAALAARSTVFKSILFGEFSESRNAVVVPIGYHSAVLKAIVEYIHTDTSEIFDEVNSARENGEVRIQEIQTTVSLVGAATYFHFPGLSRKATDTLKDLLMSAPSVSCAILEACMQEEQPMPKVVTKMARNNIQTNRKGATKGIGLLSAASLEDILQDDNMQFSEFELFQMLQQWVSSSDGNRMAIPALSLSHRQEKAAEMVKHFKLERISASLLSDVVAPSGLVSKDQLLEAYKQKALAAASSSPVTGQVSKDQLPEAYKQKALVADGSGPVIGQASKDQLLEAYKQKALVADGRGPVISNWLQAVPRWRNMKTDSWADITVLDVPPIKLGTYQWTMQLDAVGISTYLGIRTFGAIRMHTFCYSRRKDKITLFNGQKHPGWPDHDMLKYGDGSKITFVLNLTPNDFRNGTLCASVDGGPMVQLFSGLQDDLNTRHGDNMGYVPAFSTRKEFPASIRLLNIEEVRGS